MTLKSIEEKGGVDLIRQLRNIINKPRNNKRRVFSEDT